MTLWNSIEHDGITSLLDQLASRSVVMNLNKDSQSIASMWKVSTEILGHTCPWKTMILTCLLTHTYWGQHKRTRELGWWESL